MPQRRGGGATGVGLARAMPETAPTVRLQRVTPCTRRMQPRALTSSQCKTRLPSSPPRMDNATAEVACLTDRRTAESSNWASLSIWLRNLRADPCDAFSLTSACSTARTAVARAASGSMPTASERTWAAGRLSKAATKVARSSGASTSASRESRRTSCESEPTELVKVTSKAGRSAVAAASRAAVAAAAAAAASKPAAPHPSCCPMGAWLLPASFWAEERPRTASSTICICVGERPSSCAGLMYTRKRAH
eukprot:scaffold26749_cov27-Tisochrysis_lutea.AAC.2